MIFSKAKKEDRSATTAAATETETAAKTINYSQSNFFSNESESMWWFRRKIQLSIYSNEHWTLWNFWITKRFQHEKSIAEITKSNRWIEDFSYAIIRANITYHVHLSMHMVGSMSTKFVVYMDASNGKINHTNQHGLLASPQRSFLLIIMQHLMKNDSEIIILLSWSDNSFSLYRHRCNEMCIICA